MSELASPRSIIAGYRQPQQTSYFGIAPRKDDYSTDPAQLGDTTTLTGSLGGLLKAGVNSVANAGARLFNSGTPSTTFEQRNADFPAQNQQRYATPGVAPAPNPLTPAPSARSAYKMMSAHTPGEVLSTPAAPTQAAPVAAPTGATRLRRAPATPQMFNGNPEDPPQGFGEEPKPLAPMISEQTDAAGVMPAATQAALPATGGSRMYGADGTNGGFGFTKNDDGIVERMFSLRQRTPAEDAAHPQEFQPAFAPAPKDMSPGSQGAWEQEQAANALVNRPFGFKTAAALLAQRQQAEVEANNLRAHGVSQQNANTSLMNVASEVNTRDAELPGNLLKQQSDLLTANGLRGKTAADTTKINLENQFYPTTVGTENMLKGAQAGYYRAHAAQADAITENTPNKAEMNDATNATRLAVQQEKGAELQAKTEAAAQEAALPEAMKMGIPVKDAVAYRRAGGTPKVATSALNPFGESKTGYYRNGKLMTPADISAAATTPGYTPSGKYTPEGKPILIDAKGNKFVQ